MEPTRSSETSDNEHYTPGNNPKTRTNHSDHGEGFPLFLTWLLRKLKFWYPWSILTPPPPPVLLATLRLYRRLTHCISQLWGPILVQHSTPYTAVLLAIAATCEADSKCFNLYSLEFTFLRFFVFFVCLYLDDTLTKLTLQLNLVCPRGLGAAETLCATAPTPLPHVSSNYRVFPSKVLVIILPDWLQINTDCMRTMKNKTDPERESRYNTALSLTSVLAGDGSVTPGPGSFTPREWSSSHCTGSWVEPLGRYGQVRNISPPPRFDPRTAQSVARR
jgi:hypothetical protein